jgi:hypothetical protein
MIFSDSESLFLLLKKTFVKELKPLRGVLKRVPTDFPSIGVSDLEMKKEMS